MKALSYSGLGFALVFLFACQKEQSYEKGNSTGNNTVAGDFRAKINNVQWVAADNAKGASVIGGFINITGISSDNKQISITLNGTTAGTYLLDQQSFSAATYIDGNSSNTFAYATNQGADTSFAGGVVVITEINASSKTISGTFQFKVFRDMDQQQQVITAGSFTQLPYASSLPVAPTSDTFYVVVDGVGWTPPSITASVSMGKLIIAASEQDGSRSAGLVMPQAVSPGTYPMDFATGDYFGEYNPNPNTFLVSDPNGTLTILENNTSTRRIRGTFQFLAQDLAGAAPSATLSSGNFNVGY